MKKYYVIGFADTRSEFYLKGVATNKVAAEKFKTKLEKELHPSSRQWVSIRETEGVK